MRGPFVKRRLPVLDVQAAILCRSVEAGIPAAHHAQHVDFASPEHDDCQHEDRGRAIVSLAHCRVIARPFDRTRTNSKQAQQSP